MRVDARMLQAAEELGYEGMLTDQMVRERFHFPARMHGCGIRSRPRRCRRWAAVAACAFLAVVVLGSV